jgi:hypothetical protein
VKEQELQCGARLVVIGLARKKRPKRTSMKDVTENKVADIETGIKIKLTFELYAGIVLAASDTQSVSGHLAILAALRRNGNRSLK